MWGCMAGNAGHHTNNTSAGIAVMGPANGTAEGFRSRDAHPECSPGDANGIPPLTIAEVAQQYGVTPRALRFYEAKRLIVPYRRGATRFCRSSDCKRLEVILTGRRLGFTLAEIKHLLNKANDGGLQLTREQCVKQISMLEQQKRSIETAIAELREIHTAFYKRLLDKTGEPSH
jgi:DNA-binding transcriptional MerR regulator